MIIMLRQDDKIISSLCETFTLVMSSDDTAASSEFSRARLHLVSSEISLREI